MKAFDKAGYTEKYRRMTDHIKQHIDWFKTPEVVREMARTRDTAHQVLGPPAGENLVALFHGTTQIFNRFSRYSRAANIHEMWETAEAVGVKRFASETGIDIFKNSPENQRKREIERNRAMGITGVEPMIFGAPPEGVDYPHNFYYFEAEIKSAPRPVSRSLLAIKLLQSKTARDNADLAVKTYTRQMDMFRSLAGDRFGIKDWQHVPEAGDSWASHARHWSVSQYRLFDRRLQAMRKMTDPRADENWVEMNRNLGSTSSVVTDIYETVKNLPKFE